MSAEEAKPLEVQREWAAAPLPVLQPPETMRILDEENHGRLSAFSPLSTGPLIVENQDFSDHLLAKLFVCLMVRQEPTSSLPIRRTQQGLARVLVHPEHDAWVRRCTPSDIPVFRQRGIAGLSDTPKCSVNCSVRLIVSDRSADNMLQALDLFRLDPLAVGFVQLPPVQPSDVGPSTQVRHRCKTFILLEDHGWTLVARRINDTILRELVCRLAAISIDEVCFRGLCIHW